MSKGIVWVRLKPEIEQILKELARAKGISTSEYVRQLILENLDGRSFFTENVKNAIKLEGSKSCCN